MSRTPSQPSRAGGTVQTRASTRRTDTSPLDNLDEIKKKAKYVDVGTAGEFLGSQGWIPSKDPKELDNIAVSNAMYAMANALQGKDLVEGIGALATMVAAIQVEHIARVLATQITDQVAEKLDTEIETQLANIEKRMEERTTALLTAAEQAQDILLQTSKAIENASDKLSHSDFPPLTQNDTHTSHTTLTHNANSYAAIAQGNLPTTHHFNIARQRAQRRRILMDSNSDAHYNIKDLSEAQIVAKANLALEQMADSTQPAGKFTGARILRNGGVIIEANEETLIEWVQDADTRTSFQNAFDGGQAQIKDKLYAAILEFVPTAHKTGNTTEYRYIESLSNLDYGHLASTKWMKPIERRTEGQRTAHLLAKFTSARAANIAIRDGVTIAGKLVYGRKPQQEPRRCLKCQHIGPHFAAQCSQDGETCGTCGKGHATKECTERNTDHYWCVNCKTGGHASWDRMCPSFRGESERMKRRDPESSYRFYPVEDTPWTWEQHRATPATTVQNTQGGRGDQWTTVNRHRSTAAPTINPPIGTQGRGWSEAPSRQNSPMPGTQNTSTGQGQSAGPSDGNTLHPHSS